MKPCAIESHDSPHGVTDRNNDDMVDISLSDMYALHSGSFQVRTCPIAVAASSDAGSTEDMARNYFPNDTPTSMGSSDSNFNTSQTNIDREKHPINIFTPVKTTTMTKPTSDSDLERAVVHYKPITMGRLDASLKPHVDPTTNDAEYKTTETSTSSDSDGIKDTPKIVRASRFTGVVHYNKIKYRAQISVDRKVYSVGNYRLETDAAFAYDQVATRLRGCNLGSRRGRKWKTNFASFAAYTKEREQEKIAHGTDTRFHEDLSTVMARAQRRIDSVIAEVVSRKMSQQSREPESADTGSDDSIEKFRKEDGDKMNSDESFQDEKTHSEGTEADLNEAVRLQNNSVSDKNVDDGTIGRDGRNHDADVPVDISRKPNSHPRADHKAQKAAVTVLESSSSSDGEKNTNSMTPQPAQAVKDKMSPSSDSKKEAILLAAVSGLRRIWRAKKKNTDFASNDSTMTNHNFAFSSTHAQGDGKQEATLGIRVQGKPRAEFIDTPTPPDECTGRQVEGTRISFDAQKVFSSRFKGVLCIEKHKIYRSQISIDGTVYSLGNYSLETTAALAYDEAVKHLLEVKPPTDKTRRHRQTNFGSLSEYKKAKAQELDENGLDANTEVFLPGENAEIQSHIASILKEVESARRMDKQGNQADEFKADASSVSKKECEGAGEWNPVIECTVPGTAGTARETNAKEEVHSRNAKIVRCSLIERRSRLKLSKTNIDRIGVSLVHKRKHKGKSKREKKKTRSGSVPLRQSAMDEDWLKPAYMESYQTSTGIVLASLRKTYVHFRGSSGSQQPAVNIPSYEASAGESASFKSKSTEQAESETPNSSDQLLATKGITALQSWKCELIPLQKEQTTSLPFPVGCDVWWNIHLNGKGESFTHGKVSAVYFNFATRVITYAVLPEHCGNHDEDSSLTLFNGEELAYAPGCQVYYLSSGRLEEEVSLAHGEILYCRTSHHGNLNKVKGLGENLRNEKNHLKSHDTDKACRERIRDLLLKLDTDVVIDRRTLKQTGIGRTVKSVSNMLANLNDEGVVSAKKLIEKWKSQIAFPRFYYTILIYSSDGSDEIRVLQDISSTKIKLRVNSTS
eukprot:CCRYP_017030-RA/>CCRYP_017030-RA protein AED:0.08 eAED:0.34 QI:235/0.66/0.5/1/0.66/0.5/4/0/1080